MAFDHDSWLRAQGIKITGRQTLRRMFDPGYINWNLDSEDGRIDWSAERYKIREEQVYQVELTEQTIERFERMEADIHHALDHANRKYYTARGVSGYTGGPSDVTQFFIDNKERHLELLKENEMYRDAWREFQSIRVLLGETPHWP
jgi:hypothetical protein